jgi:hypothetical protein
MICCLAVGAAVVAAGGLAATAKRRAKKRSVSRAKTAEHRVNESVDTGVSRMARFAPFTNAAHDSEPEK